MRGKHYNPEFVHNFNQRGALSLHYMKNCIEDGRYKERQKLLDSYVSEFEDN